MFGLNVCRRWRRFFDLDRRSRQSVSLYDHVVAGYFAHLAGKTITAPWNGFYDLIFAQILERLSEYVDVMGEIGFLNEGIIPDVTPDLVLGDDGSAALNEKTKQIYCLQRQLYGLAIRPQNPLFEVESAPPELP
jgi:hypothetical protein